MRLLEQFVRVTGDNWKAGTSILKRIAGSIFKISTCDFIETSANFILDVLYKRQPKL
jgi:hypothetical protein